MDQEYSGSHSGQSSSKSKSVLGIIGLIVGILALVTSVIPIVNNASFVLAIIGGVLALIGVILTARGKRPGMALAIVALAINIIAIIVVLVSQSMLSTAIKSATSGPAAVQTNGQDLQSLAIGSSATFEDGLVVSVDSVQTDLKNYDGSAITMVTVTYTNNGSKDASFNEFDWKGQDASGVQQSYTYYADATNDLSSGTLVAGGTVTGNLYFEGGIVKVVYSPSVVDSTNSVAWTIS